MIAPLMTEDNGRVTRGLNKNFEASTLYKGGDKDNNNKFITTVVVDINSCFFSWG
jgi:hypothetical protein